MKNSFDQLMLSRRWTEEYLDHIDDIIPCELAHMDELCSVLHNYVGKEVIIYPDFDCDGVMAGVILYAGLNELGFKAHLHTPIPSEGYGMQPNQIHAIRKQYPNVELMITCDQGITEFGGIECANKDGFVVVVTDHHEPKQGALPNAAAIVDPWREDDLCEFKEICGATVAWKTLLAYANKFADNGKKRAINQLVVFAAIGTVSDCMLMLNNNRDIVRRGIASMKQISQNGITLLDFPKGTSPEYLTVFKGLSTLIDVLDFENLLKKITEDTFGYVIAPMINSVKRLDKDLSIVFNVFLKADVSCAEQMFELNQERKELTKSQYEQIMSSTQLFAPYVYLAETTGGMAGLLANKIMSETGMPTVVLYRTENGFAGSGRSPEWCNLKRILLDGEFSVGGHANSFGVRQVESIKLVSQMYDIIKDNVAYLLRNQEHKAPTYDVKLNEESNFTEVMLVLSVLAPFGRGFEKPTYLFETTKDHVAEIKHMGKEKQHTKVVLNNGIALIAWNTDIEELPNVIRWAGDPSINEFMGKKTNQIVGNLII